LLGINMNIRGFNIALLQIVSRASAPFLLFILRS
jgi:hypothetical protein